MIPRWVRIAVYAVCLAHTLGGSAWAETYRIGVLAFRGADHALKSWAPTAEALSHAIDGAKFEIVPLPLAALRRSVAENDVAFVFTNSGQYVALESEYGISRIVTLKTTFGRKIRNVFGAVIFTRTDRTEISTLDDLRGNHWRRSNAEPSVGFKWLGGSLRPPTLIPL